MINQLVKEAPYHPGYEDAGFKAIITPTTSELNQHRRTEGRYFAFTNAIVSYCKSEANRRQS